MSEITLTVFTKPWKVPLSALAEQVAALGFDGVELPVRHGYPVTPDDVARELPPAVRLFAEHNLRIASIAGPASETAIAACADAGIPVIRICVGWSQPESYQSAEARMRRDFDDALPYLERFGVTLGIQNHSGDRDINHAMGLRHLLEPYNPKHIAAVWDAGHNGLQGESPESALDIVWDRLCMVNLKSAFWRRVNGPEAACAQWEPYWTTGRHGHARWPSVVAELKRRAYSGVVCLTAEYSDEHAVDRLIADDISWARELLDAEP